MIKLTDKVYIKADTNNYTLTEKTIVQNAIAETIEMIRKNLFGG